MLFPHRSRSRTLFLPDFLEPARCHIVLSVYSVWLFSILAPPLALNDRDFQQVSAAEAIPAVTGKCRVMPVGACANVCILDASSVVVSAHDPGPTSPSVESRKDAVAF
jgi:hypothetical protein